MLNFYIFFLCFLYSSYVPICTNTNNCLWINLCVLFSFPPLSFNHSGVLEHSQRRGLFWNGFFFIVCIKKHFIIDPAVTVCVFFLSCATCASITLCSWCRRTYRRTGGNVEIISMRANCPLWQEIFLHQLDIIDFNFQGNAWQQRDVAWPSQDDLVHI